MIIKEYRIVLPISVDAYRIGQLYTVAQTSKNETGGGEGVQILENRPFQEADKSGQYTHKIYHVESRLPGLVRYIAPKKLTNLKELAWNAFPHCRTILSNTYLAGKFEISIESVHLPDAGTTENALQIPAGEYKKVDVVHIDIANDAIDADDYSADHDPTTFKSKGHGVLGKNWMKELEGPVMCCYKLVRCKFNVFGLQTRIERLIHAQERRLFTIFHRKLFCGIDQWCELSIDDIRELESSTQVELKRRITEGDITGTMMRNIND